MVAPLTTAGVSEVAQELQMPMVPHMLEPMPRHSRSDRDGTTQSDTLSESTLVQDVRRIPRTRLITSRTVKNQQLYLNFQFDYGYMGDGGPLQIACFLVGADTSSRAIHATMVPDSQKMDMPYVVATTAKWLRDLWYERFCLHGDKEGVLQLLLDKVGKECRPEGQDLQILRQVSPTQSHQSNGAAEKAVSTERGLVRTYLAVIKTKSRLLQ